METRFRKRHYIMGLLSLALFYVLLLGANQYWATRPTTALMRIRLIDKNDVKAHPDKYPFTRQNISKHKFAEMRLTGNAEEDDITLKYARVEIRHCKQLKDIIHGIHFKLSDACKYGTYVQMIDMCNVEGVDSYGGYDNDMWVCPVAPVSQPGNSAGKHELLRRCKAREYPKH